MSTSSTAGRLLVATPALGDDNFDRTIVFMIEHTADGALGVVLNRPSETEVVDGLPQWAELAGRPAVFFVGGPVEREGIIGLASGWSDRAENLEGAFQPLVGRMGTIDLHREPEEWGGALDQVRLFAGHAGWGPGQLDGEIAADAWFVVDADPNDLLTAEPELLWEFVLRRQPGTLSWFAHYPDDPSHN